MIDLQTTNLNSTLLMVVKCVLTVKMLSQGPLSPISIENLTGILKRHFSIFHEEYFSVYQYLSNFQYWLGSRAILGISRIVYKILLENCNSYNFLGEQEREREDNRSQDSLVRSPYSIKEKFCIVQCRWKVQPLRTFNLSFLQFPKRNSIHFICAKRAQFYYKFAIFADAWLTPACK